jgi:hypothetical protein
MKFSLNILESNSTIRTSILNALSIEVDRTISKAMPTIQAGVTRLLIEALKEEPEYTSLKNGTLRFNFGIPDTSVVDDIVDKLASTVNIRKNSIRITNAGLTGGFDITAIQSNNISGLTSDASAIVEDSERGYSLPWLEWLLLRGNEIIVQKYDVKLGPNPNSRTGNAIMIDSNKSWRVPAEFSGTSSNNWTTRAIERIGDPILSLMRQTLENNI